MADIFNIAGEINSTSQEGTAVHANQVKDDLQNKKQSQINEEVGEELELHTNRLNALTGQNYTTVQATQSTTAADIPTLINGTGEGEQTDTLYRVGFWDGSAYVADKYTEYAWNGTAYVILDVKSSIGEVFDISQYNAVGGTPTTYADLTAALSGTNVPTSVHRGGMSIKFIQSIDNKYVQYRLMTTAWSTNVTDWQGVDDEIKSGSKNLAESGGVKIYVDNSIETHVSKGKSDFSFSDELGNVLVEFNNGGIRTKSFDTDKTPHNETLQPNIDFSISDEEKNALVVFEGGHIRTKNFNSAVQTEYNPIKDIDVSLSDESGNIIAILQGGHIRTKFFDSRNVGGVVNVWNGKKWYAYGTSLTDTSTMGKYPITVENLSGMVRTNRGIGGGGLVTNRLVYNAVCNVTDGKTEADLITLECLANDGSATFGELSDTENTTFLGALGICIKYLQQNTTAQIVVISSPRGRYNVAHTDEFYPYEEDNIQYLEKCRKMQDLCTLYGVYYINPNDAMGYYRKSNLYYIDNIHHTALGGEIFGQYIWSKLKDIPLWLTD